MTQYLYACIAMYISNGPYSYVLKSIYMALVVVSHSDSAHHHNSNNFFISDFITSHLAIYRTLILCVLEGEMQILTTLLIWMLSTVAPEAEEITYSLSLKRHMNELILECSVHGSDSHNRNVTFWINETETIDIINDLVTDNAAVKIAWNVVSFQLQPQYEGTFFCGENITGDKCAGIGPIAGNIGIFSFSFYN